MPMPTLLHPIPVKVRKADHDQTAVWDDNFREPIGQVRRKQNPIELLAQVKNISADMPIATEGGVQLQADGYLLFLQRDLVMADITIDPGDRIIEIGVDDSKREVDYYFTKIVPRGHYPEYGGHTLIKAYFQDRSSSHVRNDGRRS